MGFQNRKFALCFFSAVFILLGLWLDHSYKISIPDAVDAQGTVVSFERRNSKQVYPIFEFTDAEGLRHRSVNPTQQGIIRFSEGQVLPIAYSRSHPDNARIDTFWFSHRWLISALLVSLALIGGALKQRA